MQELIKSNLKISTKVGCVNLSKNSSKEKNLFSPNEKVKKIENLGFSIRILSRLKLKHFKNSGSRSRISIYQASSISREFEFDFHICNCIVYNYISINARDMIHLISTINMNERFFLSEKDNTCNMLPVLFIFLEMNLISFRISIKPLPSKKNQSLILIFQLAHLI